MQRQFLLLLTLVVFIVAQDPLQVEDVSADTTVEATAEKAIESSPIIIDTPVSDTVSDSAEVVRQDSVSPVVKDSVVPLPPLDSGKARLVVESAIEEVIVELDGKQLGTTPLVVDTLAPGEYHFILKKKGYYGKKMGASLIADSTVALTVELRAPGSVYITSTPDSATVLINKKRVGITPFEAYPLRPDTYDLLLLRDGFENMDTTITVANGAQDTLLFNLASTIPLDTVVADTLAKLDVDVMQDDKRRKTGIAIAAASLLTVFISMIFIFESAGSN